MKNHKIKFCLLSILCFVSVAIVSYIYFETLNDRFEDKIYSYLKESTTKNVDIINAKIEDDMNSVKVLAAYLEGTDLHDDVVLKKFNQIVSNGDFKRLSIVDEHGVRYTSDQHIIDESNSTYYIEAMQGKSNITETMIDPIDKSAINMYSTPIYRDGKVQAALLATRQTDTLSKMVMSMRQYNDSFSLVADENGKVVLTSDVDTVKLRLENKDRELISINKGHFGTTTYTSKSKNKTYLVSYAPLKYNDWYAVSFVPSSHVNNESKKFNNLATTAFIAILGITLILLGYSYFYRNKNRKEKQKILFHDVITDGNNFNWFQIEITRLRENRNLALLLIDIKDFRLLNRIYGFHIGDQLLRTVMEKLQSREHTFLCNARKDNDIFISVMQNKGEKKIFKEIDCLIQEIKKNILDQYGISDIQIHVGISYLKENDDVLAIIDQANEALNYCNRENIITIYNTLMDEHSINEKELEEKMTDALKNNEFKVFVQPKVNISTGKIVGGEALVRWDDPQKGMVSPGDFIPLFERNGFLENVDFFVYETVCNYLKKLEKYYNEDFSISFNVSPTYIYRKRFVERLKEISNKYNIKTSLLEVEITETALAKDVVILISIIQDLHKEGFHVALDDFGSGYSSLNMLKEIPAETLKIDQGFFVNRNEYQKRSEDIVSCIIQMANKLNMKVVVEGIETQEQLNAIQLSGAKIVQGYYYYKPMPIEEFALLIIKGE